MVIQDFLALQEQVGHEMSLPTQISPPYSHQSQGTVERFHKTLYGQVRAIRIGLADHLNIDADHLDAAFMPWIIQHVTFQINRYLVRSDGKTSFEKVFKKPQRSPIVHLGERVKGAIKQEPISLSSVGHEVYDPVPLNLLSSEDQAKIIESRWVIGPRSGQLKARFVGKGYTQIIDKESKYAHTPQATTLKIILLMSQIHKWSLCVPDAFLNTPIDGSKGFIHVQAPPETQYPEPTVWRLKRQLYGLRDSPRSWQVHLNQVLKSLDIFHKRSQIPALSQVRIPQVISTSWSWLTSMTSS